MNDLRSSESPVMEPGGLDRRSFVKVVTMAAAAVGLNATAAAKMVEAAAAGIKPSVIWLHFQECTGCTESLLRTSHPDIAKLILDLVSLDYHETLMAAAGDQAEEALHAAMTANEGKYICVVEGAIPTKDDGIYCMIGGKTALQIVNEVAEKAGAIVAIGSCASWGGIPSADPNPTGATGAPMVLKGKTVVTLPGCPANPYIFLGTALQFVALGSLPALDDKGRPMFAYGRTIHEHCPRRAHFDAGRFVQQFGDEGHRLGYCLYKTGLQGPGHPRELLDAALRRGGGRVADRPRPPLLRLHRAEPGLPHAAARHRHDRAADAARHLPGHPRGAGAGRCRRDRRRRPRGGRGPRRGLPFREEAGPRSPRRRRRAATRG